MRRRPSKVAMLRGLRSDLSKEKGEVAIDAASSHMKYRRFFKTKKYYGIDWNEQALRKGLERYPNDYGIVADLVNLKLPKNSVDVCVSTHTLEHLLPKNQIQVLRNLISTVKPNGKLLLTKVKDGGEFSLLQLLHSSFKVIQISYYRNFLSQPYERLFVERNGRFTSSWFSSLLPLKFVSYLLSWMEHLTAWNSKWNDSLYIRCRGKLEGGAEQPFSLKEAERLESHLYKLKG